MHKGCDLAPLWLLPAELILEWFPPGVHSAWHEAGAS